MARKRTTARVPALALLLGLLVATVAACSTDADTLAETQGLPSLQVSLEAHAWVLQPEPSTPRVDAGETATIVFDGDSIHGRAPCNTFNGTVAYGNDDALTISKLATSQQTCGPAADQGEHTYLTALRLVRSADVPVDHEDRATLTGKRVRLVFHALDVPDRLTRTWSIVKVSSGESIASVAPGTEPTVTFEAGGDLSLQTGCNPVTGSWELDGDALQIDALGQGLKACAGPEGEQEAALTRALQSAATVELTPETLTLVDGHGRIALIATTEKGDR
jgi:heat shock protein HslJ